MSILDIKSPDIAAPRDAPVKKQRGALPVRRSLQCGYFVGLRRRGDVEKRADFRCLPQRTRCCSYLYFKCQQVSGGARLLRPLNAFHGGEHVHAQDYSLFRGGRYVLGVRSC